MEIVWKFSLQQCDRVLKIKYILFDKFLCVINIIIQVYFKK